MDEAVTCRHCGDVIGVYEPMIVVAEAQARTTSRLREPDAPGDRYHHACYLEVHGDEPLT